MIKLEIFEQNKKKKTKQKLKCNIFMVEAAVGSRYKQLENIYKGQSLSYKFIATSSDACQWLKYLLYEIIHHLHSLEYVIYLRVKNCSAFCIRSSFPSRICKDALFRPVLSQNDNHRIHRLHHVWNFPLLV